MRCFLLRLARSSRSPITPMKRGARAIVALKLRQCRARKRRMIDLHPLQMRLLALRERGVAEAALYRIEALLLRMQGCDSELCAALEPRVCALLEQAEHAPHMANQAASKVHTNPLTDLLQMLSDAQSNTTPASSEDGEVALTPAASPMLEDARRVWRAVRARSQLRESLAQPQEHAGPLNSGRLVLRMIDTMQAASPEYLECLLTYIDVLAALEPLTATAAQGDTGAAPKRATRARKRRE